MTRAASAKHLSVRVALWRLGIRQSLKGALVVGVLVGFMAVVQGLAFGSTYPDEKSRQAFATTMESAPALGILYGETKNLASSAGYMVYRTVPIMALVVSVWALLTTTKLLRGQEEDGRWEVVAAGSTTPRQASMLTLLGFTTSFFTAFLVAALILILAGSFPELSTQPSTSIFIAAAIFLPGLLFAAAGVLTSQLAITRRRAAMYVLVPLLTFFGLRSIANTIPDWYWLKNVSPFGWSDMINPVLDPMPVWLLPALLLSPLLTGAGIYLIGKRDYGAGFIAEATKAASRLFLLRSALGLGLRQNLSLYVGWSVATLAISVLVASIMGIAAEAVAESPNLGAFIGQLGGSTNDLKIAFLGAGMVFVTIALLIMATASMSSIRKDEAKNYLDTLLAQPVRRSHWLAGRLFHILVATAIISMACVLSTWAIAGAQGITLNLWTMMQIGIALMGTVIFLLGFGVLLFGIAPRFAVIGMYSLIAWSFVIDILGSVITLHEIIVKSSLFHYVPVNAAKTPDWGIFILLVLFGIALAGVGIAAFSKRDIVTE